jgi:signal transduction histidine kinase
MRPESGGVLEPETTELDKIEASDLPLHAPEVVYRPLPHDDITVESGAGVVWRVRFALASDPSMQFGLDVNGDIEFGREGDSPDFVDLSSYDADLLGVSRRHLRMHPTLTNLYVIDLSSTNGTWRNGRRIGANTPYGLADGDVLTLGRLELTIDIVKRPRGRTGHLHDKADLGEVLVQMAKAITSQWELQEVLNQALEMAMSLTMADEAAIWLLDEQTGEFFLEASRGVGDREPDYTHLPMTDSIAGEVLATGELLRASRADGAEPIEVTTGHQVEAVLYVPLILGCVALGVLMVSHRKIGSTFSQRDEKLLAAIGDVAAIAVQNARLIRDLEQSFAEVREAQSRLVRTARLAALGELAAMVAHQINNPLTTILGDAEMLMQDLPEGHTGHESAAAVFRAGQRAKTVVDRLLHLARPATHTQPLDVNSTIQAALDLVSGRLQATGNRLAVDLASELPVVDALPGQLEDVWLNLLMNAHHAQQDGEPGTIGVSSALVRDGLAIEVTVWDTGTGIPPEDLERVFDPFFTTKPRDMGTGLGLYICKQIVNQHKGHISITSELGQGTRVSVRLPVASAHFAGEV